MTLIIYRMAGKYYVSIHGQGREGATVETREFARLSHRAWGYLRRAMTRMRGRGEAC